MILINGNFLCRNLTGIERFAWEILAQLDGLLQNGEEIALLVPKNARKIPEYKNIRLIHDEKELTSFPRWDLFYFRKRCRQLHADGLNFSNTAPLGCKIGYAFIHDIYAKDFPEDFTTRRDKLIKLYCRLNYWNIACHAKKVLTVSEFTKERIKARYHTKADKIEVIPNGWDHFSKTGSDDRIFERFPVLKQKPFYFTLGSLQKRKNLKWILEYARKHPDENFAISGKTIGGMHTGEISDLSSLSNVTMLGYVTDEEVKSLMKACSAFVFPSYYEGFGIPPLEALSTGAKIIVAKAASLPEIYKDAAVYIDPFDTDTELAELIKKRTADASAVLETFTYKKSAEKLRSVLFSK